MLRTTFVSLVFASLIGLNAAATCCDYNRVQNASGLPQYQIQSTIIQQVYGQPESNCCNQCTLTPGCVAYDYVTNAVGNCSFYKDVGDLLTTSPNSFYDSGSEIRGCPCETQWPGKLWNAAQPFGWIYSSDPWDNCCNWCSDQGTAANPTCNFFAYQFLQTFCRFYSNVTYTNYQPGQVEIRNFGFINTATNPAYTTGVRSTGVQTTGIQTTGVQTTGVQTTGVQTTGVQTTGYTPRQYVVNGTGTSQYTVRVGGMNWNNGFVPSQNPGTPVPYTTTGNATSLAALDGIYEASDLLLCGNQTYYAVVSSMNFNIPATATINGLQFIVTRYATGTSSGGDSFIRDYAWQLRSGTVGSNVGNLNTNWPVGGEQAVTYGSPTTFLGNKTVITPSVVNDPSFGYQFSVVNYAGSAGCQSQRAWVDQAVIQVYYTY